MYDFSNPDDMLSDPATASTAFDVYNTGDGSGYFDEPTGDTVSGASSPVEYFQANSTQAANTVQPNAGSGGSGWSTFFGSTLPGVFGTAANVAASAAGGIIATQTKTAATPNRAATGPAPGVSGFTAFLNANKTMLLIGGAVLVGAVFFFRGKKAKS